MDAAGKWTPLTNLMVAGKDLHLSLFSFPFAETSMVPWMPKNVLMYKQCPQYATFLWLKFMEKPWRGRPFHEKSTYYVNWIWDSKQFGLSGLIPTSASLVLRSTLLRLQSFVTLVTYGRMPSNFATFAITCNKFGISTFASKRMLRFGLRLVWKRMKKNERRKIRKKKWYIGWHPDCEKKAA